MAGRHVILLAVAVAVAVARARRDTQFGDCTRNSHCDPLSCCRVGFMRYSIPTCSPRAAVGAPCSPVYATPSSRALFYPNGITVHVEEAHFGLCPCQPGLACTAGTCQPAIDDSAPSSMQNSISLED